jgi:hypothetical protein
MMQDINKSLVSPKWCISMTNSKIQMSIVAQQGKLQQIDRVEMEMHVPADSCAF